jgi:TrmH family RNA methyltransferase
MSLARIRVVLVRPRHAGNVGGAARAMKNMGLHRLVLVAPEVQDLRTASATAVHAADVLAAATTTATLAEAVADCGLVVATSGRAHHTIPDAASPRALAATILAASARNDVALVFGPEDHGLSNDDLGHCHRVLTIPASAAYGSLNLAHAVLLCAYELFVAASPAADERVLATGSQLELLVAKLEAALGAIGYLQPDSAGHMMRSLRRMLGRAALDNREVQALLGVARQMAWAARARRVDQTAPGGMMNAPAGAPPKEDPRC